MLRYSLVIMAGFWAAGYAGAATWADGLFNELNKDFGSVPRGPTQTHHFQITNNTRGPVAISNIRVSCGCVTATVFKTFLNPGESTAVQAKMDTTRFIGVRSVTIYVQFSQPAFEEVRLWVSANARHDFNVTPDTLNVGQMKRGTDAAANAQVTFYGNRDAQIVSVKGESNYIIPEFKEVRRLDSEVVYQVTARMRSDIPVGKWYTDVWVRTNLPSMPQVRLPLTVDVESALTASPDTVALGKIKIKADSERRVIVRGIKPFKIVKIQGTDDELQVRDNTLEAKEVHVLTVKLKPDRSGPVARRVKVFTDLKEDNEIDFQISALVQEE